jgi:hypothetical protein
MATLPGLNVGIALDAATFISETRRVEQSVDRMARGTAQQAAVMSRGFNTAAAAAKNLAAGLGVGFGIGAVTGLIAMAKNAVAAADEIGELAQRVGIGTGALQALQHQAEQSGSSVETLTSGLETFARGVGQAQAGTGRLHSQLEKLDPLLLSQLKTAHDQEAALDAVADALARSETATKDAAIATAVFGGANAELAVVLGGGAAEIDRFAAEARDLGLILDQEVIEAAMKTSDEMAKLSRVIGIQLTNSIGAAVVEFAKFTGILGVERLEALQRELVAVEDELKSIAATAGIRGGIADVLEAIGLGGLGEAIEAGKLAQANELLEQRAQILNQLRLEGEKQSPVIARTAGAIAEETEEIEKQSAAFKPLVVDIHKAVDAFGDLTTTFRSDPEADLRLRQLNSQRNNLERIAEAYKKVGQEAESSGKVVQASFSEMSGDALAFALDDLAFDFARTFDNILQEGVTAFEDLADAAGRIFTNLTASIGQSFGATFASLGAFGGPLGSVLGATAGVGAMFGLQKLFGNLFGGGPSGSQVSLGTGSLGGAAAGGSGEAAGVIRSIDEQLIDILGVRQEKLADRLLRDARSIGIQYGDEGPSANDLSRLAATRIAPTARALGFEHTAIAGRGRAPEQQLALLQEAIQLERAIEDMTGAVTPFRRSILDLRSSFAEAEARAKEFGISTAGMGRALRQAEDQLRAQRQFERDSLRLQLQQTIAAGNSALALKVGIAAIRFEFDHLADSAEELGVSMRLVRQAERAAIRQAKEAAQEAARAAREEARATREAAREAQRQRQADRAAELAGIREGREAARATFRELTNVGGSDLEREIDAVNQRFKEFRPIAKEYGLSIAALNEAQLKITRGLAAAAREAAVENFRELTQGDFANEIDAINDRFREARILAQQFGLSIGDLNRAQLEAVRAAEKRQQAEIDALALSVVGPFENILNSLQGFSDDLEFSLLNPAAQFAKAGADFEKIGAAALGGDLTAIEQLQSAGQRFIQEAGEARASPGRVEAENRVLEVISKVESDVAAAQKDAAQGIEGAVGHAERAIVDQLVELVLAQREVGREVQKLQAELRQTRKV